MNRLLLLAALAALSAPAALAQTCSTEWTGAVGDDFDTAENWTNGVPLVGAVGCIIAPGTYTVALRDTAPFIQTYGVVVVGSEGAGRQTIALVAGVAGAYPNVVFNQLLIRPNGGLDMYGGVLIDGTAIANEGLLRFISNSGGSIANSVQITNTGTIEFDQTAGAFTLQGRIVNEAAGTIRWVGPRARIVFDNAAQIVNRGLVTSTGGAGDDFNEFGGAEGVPLSFVNEGGRVEVLDGELRISMGQGIRLEGGQYDAAADARLLITATTNEMEGTLAGTPAGTVEFAVGANGATATGSGATLLFGGTGLRWTRGFGRGAWRNEGRIVVAGTGAGVFEGGTLTNTGRIEVEAVSLSALNNASILNDVDGVIAFTGPNTTVAGGGGAPLVNRGRVVAEAGPAFWTGGNAAPGLLFDGGRLEALGGDLTVSSTGTTRYQGGTYVAEAGRTLTLSSTYAEADGLLAGEGEGQFVLYFGNSETQRPEDEGVLAFGGQGIRLDNPAFNGAWRNTGRVVHSLPVTFQDATFVNEGTAVWPAQHVFQNTTYVNEADGRIEMPGGSNGAIGDPATTALVNRGLLVLQTGPGGPGLAGFDVSVTNAAGGEIRAEAGTIVLNALADEAGAVLSGTGTIQPPSGFTVAGTIAPGNAPDQPGTLAWNGPLAVASSFVLGLDVAGPDAGTGYDRLVVTGAAALAGTLRAHAVGGYAPPVGTAFPGVLTATAVADSFATRAGDPAFSVVYAPTAVDLVLTMPVGAEDGPPEASDPTAFAVAALSNPSAQPSVRVTLPEASALAVDVYDVQGRRVARLADETRSAGVHALPLAGLAPGVYVARVVAAGPTGTERATQRLVVVR